MAGVSENSSNATGSYGSIVRVWLGQLQGEFQVSVALMAKTQKIQFC
jgi:hypothetical protein